MGDEDLHEDWDAVWRPSRSKNKAKGPDLHEDWVTLKGGRYPPFAWVLKWEHAAEMYVWRMIIVGKRKDRDGTWYQARCQALVFKTPGLKVMKGERPQNTHYSRSELCFTREEVVRAIQNARMEHLYKAAREMRRLNDLIRLYSDQMKSFENFLVEVQRDPVPVKVLKRIPPRPSKRLVIPS